MYKIVRHFNGTKLSICKIRVLDAIEIVGKFEGHGQLMQLNLIEVRNGQFGPIGMC